MKKSCLGKNEKLFTHAHKKKKKNNSLEKRKKIRIILTGNECQKKKISPRKNKTV